MLYVLLSIVFFGLAIWGAVFAYKNRANMPFGVYGMQEHRCEVIDKDGFNRVMIAQSLSLSLWFIISGVTSLIVKSPIVISLPAISVFISMAFMRMAKRHLRIR